MVLRVETDLLFLVETKRIKAPCLLCASHLPTSSAAWGQGDQKGKSGQEPSLRSSHTPALASSGAHGPHEQSERAELQLGSVLTNPSGSQGLGAPPQESQRQNRLLMAAGRVWIPSPDPIPAGGARELSAHR